MNNNEEKFPFCKEPLQAQVMQDYIHSPAIKDNPDGAHALHRFFSPYRVPIGLTDEEVETCVKMCQRKKNWETGVIEREQEKVLPHIKEITKHSPHPYYSPEQLAGFVAVGRWPRNMPIEFTTYPMTREQFSKGMEKLQQLMLTS